MICHLRASSSSLSLNFLMATISAFSLFLHLNTTPYAPVCSDWNVVVSMQCMYACVYVMCDHMNMWQHVHTYKHICVNVNIPSPTIPSTSYLFIMFAFYIDSLHFPSLRFPSLLFPSLLLSSLHFSSGSLCLEMKVNDQRLKWSEVKQTKYPKSPCLVLSKRNCSHGGFLCVWLFVYCASLLGIASLSRWVVVAWVLRCGVLRSRVQYNTILHIIWNDENSKYIYI